MIRRGWNIGFRVTGRYLPYLAFLLLLFLLSTQSYSLISNKTNLPAFPVNSAAVLNKPDIHFILTLLGTLIVICTVIVFFSIKFKIVNRELQKRNKQILDINIDLQRTNSELAIQKALITKEHYESDKFYGMLFQSADDGISFYDRDWNLKFANSAFYSIIGLDRDSYNSMDPRDLIHPDDHDYQIKRGEALIINGFFESELRLRHKDGHFINLSNRSVTVRSDNGEVLGALTISRDITRLKQAHEDLIKAHVEASLSAIVNEIIEEARQVIRRSEKPIIMNVKDHFEDYGDLIFTDRIWLKRVLNHLMDNAIKFTLDGSIEFSYLLENENIIFKIKDTGIGIKKENLGRIFEEFRQEIDGHHRPFEGLGIGLTLAKEVVERMAALLSPSEKITSLQ